MLNTHTQEFHPLLPRGTHDERARQEFVKSLHERASGWSRVEAGRVYRGRVLPAFVARKGRPPASKAEIRAALGADPFWQGVVGLRRSAQELLWDVVIDTVERESATLTAAASRYAGTLGSLRLDPGLPLPEYVAGTDYHAMPGSYQAETHPGDLRIGAVFDRGAYLYTHGFIGPLAGNLGQGAVDEFRTRWPDLEPRRMVDLGCAIGTATLAWVSAFPQAEVHAIDVAAPCLRYGHARAAALGKCVHFAQQNAERTDFPEAHFDLVVSHILFHETSREAIGNIIRESFRLLRPGGVMLHVDLPDLSRAPDLLMQVTFEQDHHDNNEPLWNGYLDLDMAAIAREAGFPAEAVVRGTSGMLLSVPPSSHDPDRFRTMRSQFGYGLLAARK
jgi:SAM-dependent methyltransferase